MRVLAATLTVFGCGGIVVVAYLLCAEKVKPQADELLAGTVNPLGFAILVVFLADVGGGLLLAWATRSRRPAGEDSLLAPVRPAWAKLLLVLAVLVPVSVALWFGVLCRLVG